MNKELSFEQANKQLEEIVAKMEKPDVPLDEMMKLYEEAYKLLIFCTKKLEDSRGQIVDINERIENLKTKGDSLFED